MKKSIKMMALGLAVVPCALMLTACGGDKNIVDIKGDYKPLETAQYDAAVEEIDAGFNLEEVSKGLRSVITINAESNVGMLGKVDLSFKNESILKSNTVDNVLNVEDIEGYSNVSAKMTIKAQGQSASETMSAKQYIVDGNQYVNLSGAESMLEMAQLTLPSKFYQVLAKEGVHPVELPDYKISDLLAMVPEGTLSNETVSLSKSTEETGYKYKVVVDDVALNQIVNEYLTETGVKVTFNNDVVFYALFENNQFMGAYLDAQATVEVVVPANYAGMFGEKVSVDLDLNLQVVGYEGNINYPSDLNNYTLIEA